MFQHTSTLSCSYGFMRPEGGKTKYSANAEENLPIVQVLSIVQEAQLECSSLTTQVRLLTVTEYTLSSKVESPSRFTKRSVQWQSLAKIVLFCSVLCIVLRLQKEVT
jgi:sulfite reductase alpha subunit-like flavoprotein